VAEIIGSLALGRRDLLDRPLADCRDQRRRVNVLEQVAIGPGLQEGPPLALVGVSRQNDNPRAQAPEGANGLDDLITFRKLSERSRVEQDYLWGQR
jgi:hypothetical protein